MSINDALYMVYPQFAIVSILGRSEYLGDFQGWSIQDALTIKAEHPCSFLFGNLAYLQPLSCLLTVNLQYFADYEGGSCELDSPELRLHT